MTEHGFPAAYRLKSRKVIQRIFAEGESIHAYPVRIVWLIREGSPGELQVGFTVPKRSFKRAVDRNLIRRRMFEALRKRTTRIKDILEADGLSAMLIYTGREIAEYSTIETAMEKLIAKFRNHRLRSKSGEE